MEWLRCEKSDVGVKHFCGFCVEDLKNKRRKQANKEKNKE